MAVARLAVATEEHIVGCVEEQHVSGRSRSVERLEILLRFGKERPAARVDHECDLLLTTLPRDLDGRGHECGRKVVEGVVAEVFEDLCRLRLARAGKSRDDDEVRLTRRGQSGKIHDRTRPAIEMMIAP